MLDMARYSRLDEAAAAALLLALTMAAAGGLVPAHGYGGAGGTGVAGFMGVAAGGADFMGRAAGAEDPFELARQYPPESGPLRLEIDRSARELHIYIGDERVRTLPVAVGQEGHATPTGEYAIHQVDWNPDWTPPDSEWSADAEYKAPGEEGNPMGRARLIFQAPYSIHGTDAMDSLGRAASHGSVRVSNAEVLGLARLVQEHGGATRDEAWFQNAADTPTEMFEVPLSDAVPLVIRD
jgi:lipoprotein-anchoring transpeptidase ErfK/SrfK